MPPKSEPNEQWRVSKSVPITLIVALVLQFAGIVWTVSTMQATIDRNAKDISQLEVQVEILRRASSQQAIQLGRIEEGIKSINKQLESLSTALLRK